MARSDHPGAEALLAAIVSSSDDAIISKTLDGRMTSWNASAERLFGHSAEEAIGQSIFLIIPPERRDEEAHIIERIARGERVVEHFETVRVAKDGRRVDLSLTISPVRDRAGRVIGASKVARDISDRRSIEGEARRAQDLLRLIVDNVPALISYVDRDYVYQFNNRAYETWFEQPVLDMTESDSETQVCQDGIDNDGDGDIDFDGGTSANHGIALGTVDAGCPLPYATTEFSQCDDGVDNDRDGLVDFADPTCSPAWPYWEATPECGLGAELALVLPLLGVSRSVEDAACGFAGAEGV